MPKTIVTSANLSDQKVKEALSNPFGMSMENSPEVRKAIAKGIDDILKELHSKK